MFGAESWSANGGQFAVFCPWMALVDSSAITVRGVVVFFGAPVELRMSILRGAIRQSSGSPEYER